MSSISSNQESRQSRGHRRSLIGTVIALLVCGLAVVPLSPAVAAAPTNDAVTSPVAFGQADLPFSFTGSSVDATADTGGRPDPVSPCGSSGHTVWFRFTPKTDLTARLDVSSPDGFPPVVDVYRQSGTGLTGLQCPSSGGPVWFKGGGTYYLMLSSSFAGVPAYTFTVMAVTPPPNDSIRTPVVFSQADLPFSHTQDTLTATADTGGRKDPVSPCGSAGQNSVWFKFTPSTDLTARMDLTGGDFFPPIVDVYRQSRLGKTALTCAPSGGPIWFKGGATYYLMLSSNFDGRPTFTFRVTAVTPPPNDAVRTPIVFRPADLPFAHTQDSLTATSDTGGKPDPVSVCGAQLYSVWYRFRPAATTDVTISTDGADGFPPEVSVYSRSPDGSLAPVACAPGLTSTPVTLTGGTTYFFMLTSFFDGRPAFTFSVTRTAAAAR
jgi:hypothetical protein